VLVAQARTGRSLGTFDRARLVHAEQAFELRRPLPVAGTARVTATVTGIYDKGSGALVVSENVAVDAATSEPLVTSTTSAFIVGEGGFGGDRRPRDAEPWARPERDPDLRVTQPTRPEQALLYRLSGDRNPLHTDPAFAARGGFATPILHGLCTYGFAGRALLHAVCGGDPACPQAIQQRLEHVLLAVRLKSGVVYRGDSDELQAARTQLVSYSARLLADGLAIGSAGNMSVRAGDLVAITPSGISYDQMRPEDVCVIALDGTELDSSETPSSETPMHLAIYAETKAAAVVHTHSPEVIALSASRPELPAIHYAITGLGGTVRVAPYVRFGSDQLAAAAVAALDGRSAVILRNHGAVTYGRDLAQAYDRALLLEWLARTYRMALSYGEPATLSAAELDEVTAEARRRRYGERRGGPPPAG
jgi:ribulose-5-phosphate 4-epimerase/fuculose-1-phosphate aldolase